MTFEEVLEHIENRFAAEWKNTDELSKVKLLERQKQAIMGYEDAMAYYKARISDMLEENELSGSPYPPWYSNLTEAVFNELYGLAGLAPWVYDETEEYRDSSSAKLIGDRLYCLINGKSCLQPQTICSERREQLKRALLMAAPKERLEKGFHEIYLKNGIRVTIYSGDRTKEDQDVMVFRKYTVNELTFENMADLGTLPKEAIPIFRLMIKTGFNILICGSVRSGKTTFLQTWQRYEDTGLEGLCLSTDPETRWEEIMPDAPLMQLVCDGKDLEEVTKSILRGDNDYVLLEEMRDEIAFKTALDITSTGTMRSKATVHSQDPVNLPYRMAMMIRSRYGGDIDGIILRIFRSFHYVIELCQVESDRSKKKLRAIYEYCYDLKTDRIIINTICLYDPLNDCWKWKAQMGNDKLELFPLYYRELSEILERLGYLEKSSPIVNESVIYPKYYRPHTEGELPCLE